MMTSPTQRPSSEAYDVTEGHEITTTYDVRVVGRIWQPGFTCADHVTIASDDLCQMAAYDDLMAVADCEAWCDSHLGDFQSIDHYDIRRVDAWSEFAMVDGWEISTRAQRFTQLESFTDEVEDAWNDAMNPPEFDDDEADA